jgi:hypothetical protein
MAAQNWDFNGQSISVTLVRNGEEETETFIGNTTIRDALRAVARKYSVTSFVVTDSNGREIPESEGHKFLSEVGNLRAVPKASGACE